MNPMGLILIPMGLIMNPMGLTHITHVTFMIVIYVSFFLNNFVENVVCPSFEIVWSRKTCLHSETQAKNRKPQVEDQEQ